MARLLSWSKWIEQTNTANQTRREMMAANAFASAGIPTKFADLTVRSFRALTSNDPGKQAAFRQAMSLVSDGYVEDKGARKKSLLLWSHQRGVGKTGLLTPVFQALLRKGASGLWLSWQQLVEQVESGYKTDDAYSRLQAAREVGVLLIDDLGYQWVEGDGLSAHALKVLNSVIFHRHAWDLPTLFTSNLSPEELTEQLRPEHYQRIAEMAAVIEMTGDLLRPV